MVAQRKIGCFASAHIALIAGVTIRAIDLDCGIKIVKTVVSLKLICDEDQMLQVSEVGLIVAILAS